MTRVVIFMAMTALGLAIVSSSALVQDAFINQELEISQTVNFKFQIISRKYCCPINMI
jgi:hypothetical protein